MAPSFDADPAEWRRRQAPTFRPNVLVRVLQHADARGVDSTPWLAAAGLEREALFDPATRLSWAEVHAFLTRALAGCGEPALGLQLGGRDQLGTFGLLGLRMLASRTFGEAVAAGVRNHELAGALLHVGFVHLGEDAAALVLWPRHADPELEAFLSEELVSSAIAMARQLLGADFAPRRIELAYAAPPSAELYARVLGAPVHFGAPVSRIIFAGHWLKRPLASHNPLAARLAEQLCRRQAMPVPADDDVVVTVANLLRSHCRRRLTMAQAAALLACSERSLRRRLDAAGTSFRQLHDQVRRARALELLGEPGRPLASIAAAVGFSDAREFRRAFKRWTGYTPHAARAADTLVMLAELPPSYGRVDPPARAADDG